MAIGCFTKEDLEKLRENPYVSMVSHGRIFYTEEFKRLFTTKYLAGQSPVEIFREAGFDTVKLGNKRIERASANWRKKYNIPSLQYDREKRKEITTALFNSIEEYNKEIEKLKAQINALQTKYHEA
ncbi:MAG: hypothetical protein Q4E54_03300 [Lachnospiraceae bacterium]|nr:hypothetical protein [Lachnospiraceae bacterium]